MVDQTFASADYTLRWPADIVARELTTLRSTATGNAGDDKRIEFLIDEAFVGDAATARYQALRAQKHAPFMDDPWAGDPDPGRGGDPESEFLDVLTAALPQLRLQPEPRPYWPDRHGRARGRLDQAALQRRFAQLIGELRRTGHFGVELPEDCVDVHDAPDADVLLTERLGIPGLWPLQPEQWDADTFLGLIEVFHDLSVRPRERWWHQYDACGWHYSVFSFDTGQALYRWRINRLLDTAGIGLRLADSGEDVGRLVQTTDAGRNDLLHRVRTTPVAPTAARVDHAIALFRGRGASEHDKRSAVITLAGVLEERRELIRADLGRSDEGALFMLANNFAIRHQRRGQQADYDPAFLDWMFWWYLATLELTDRLLARDAAQSAVAPATS